MSQAQLRIALTQRGFETLSFEESKNQIRVMGRVGDNVNIANNWLLVVHRLLSRMEEANWKVDPSKAYMLVEGRVRFAWRLIFQGADISMQYASIISAVTSAPKSNRVEVTEFMLPGASANRNSKGNVTMTSASGPTRRR